MNFVLPRRLDFKMSACPARGFLVRREKGIERTTQAASCHLVDFHHAHQHDPRFHKSIVPARKASSNNKQQQRQ
jgi:hypothetical protein